MLPLSISSVFGDFLSLFYPHCCVGCSDALIKGEELICTRCMLEMPQTFYHLDPDNILRKRLHGRIPVEQVMAFLKFSKNGCIQQLLHNLKYKHQPEIGVTLGKVYGQRLRDSGLHFAFDMIVPVPLHKSRLRKRGYNQSAKFAAGLSATLGVPVYEDVLFRKTRTETQTRKNKLSRWENVADVFLVRPGAEIRGRHILLTDDVITTGATVEACGQVLAGHGCRLSIACIASA